MVAYIPSRKRQRVGGLNKQSTALLKARPINGNNPLTLMIANHFLYYPTPKSLNYN
jgi:hypothetical protein